MRALVAAMVAVGLALAWAAPGGAAGKSKRYGIEADFLEYDAARDVFKVRVEATKVSGGFGTGGVAGDPAPKSIRAGEEMELAVVPEGSVLRRTVIKGSKGEGLDNSGTREGFARAASVIPTDRPVVLSLEENTAKAEGKPDWVIRMVMIRLSPEEIRKRLQEMGIDPDEIE